MLYNVLSNIADQFPQAPPAGGTPRMREAITEVNRMNDWKNDSIHANGIDIQKYLELTKEHKLWGYYYYIHPNNEDYIGFIMEVINKIITVTQDSTDDYRERTAREIFDEFNHKLCYLSQEKEYH